LPLLEALREQRYRTIEAPDNLGGNREADVKHRKLVLRCHKSTMRVYKWG